MFRNLFEFPVSRPFPYGRLWNILTLIFSIFVLAFLVVYATATAGYETVTMSSNNYNHKSTGWYTIFIPQRGDNCDTQIITVADKVYTTNGSIPWTVMSWRDRKTGETPWATDYAAEKIQSCVLTNMVMEFNMQVEISTIFVSMNCTMDKYEVSLASDIRFPLNIQVAKAMWASIGFTAAKVKAVNWNALFDLTLAWDGIRSLYAAAQNQPNYRLSVGLETNATEFCGFDMCNTTCDGANTSVSDDLNDRYQQDFPGFLGVPFTNLAVWISQVVFWDLGLASSTNLIRDYAARPQYIRRCPTCTQANQLLDRDPGGLWVGGTLPLDDPGFTPPKDQGFNVQYLCRVRVRKSAANLVQSVLVAVLSLFAAYWAFYRTVWVFWGTHFGKERHKRVFNGEPETPTPTSMLSYGPVKPGSPVPGYTGNPPVTYPQPTGYFVQQNP
ncbi:uncharacterized protein CcaverHIS019_0604960 [Cutaneotrichosporon cavernicola]|uniref:Uncharacterized protein n=1 Tax=Cutaneotrichosporon cavernicola TaxID=279322 RepID=A0AA48QY31_9TREE|nr:uncharacterized protein CcaverHIS019_0604960 [Cutaneotrichosporon cavernicola]BEI94037.1 hypothetical protein CcaverHIS019_0604960 [Cutaneotrichosporon cavernicola]